MHDPSRIDTSFLKFLKNLQKI